MPLSRWQPPILRRDAEQEERVTWLELFFDLVFVASLIQLGNVLADDLTWAGAGRFLALFVLLFWNWSGTTIFMNRIAVDDWVHRVLVLSQMFAVAGMAVHVPVAFTDDPSFALYFVAARVLLVAMWVHAKRVVPAIDQFANVFIRLFSGAIVVWLVSLAVPAPYRYAMWAVAILVEGVGLAVERRVRDSLDSSTHGEIEHLQERFALFTIIVLGEGFVKVTDTLAGGEAGTTAPVYAGLGLVIMASIWWTYFDDVADAEVRRDGFWSLNWTNAHLPLTAAITAFGVALKKLVEVGSFADPIRIDKAVLLGGTFIAVMLAVAVLDVATRPAHFAVATRHRVVPRLVAAGAVGVLLVFAGSIPALMFVAGVAVVAVAQIGAEVRVALRGDRWVDEQVAASLADTGEVCDDLGSIPVRSAERLACEPCAAKDANWVSLRLCVDCGHVGCCDDTEGRHSTAHWESTGHRVIRSLEPHEHWAWCFEHEAMLDDWRPRRGTPAH